jgi:FkbM family methyltransferase
MSLRNAARRTLLNIRHNCRDVYDSYLSRPVPAVRTPLGFLFSGSSSQHHRAMQAGTFEPDEVRVLTALLRDASLFIDVGANAGYFTCLARHLGCAAVAIEPLPANVAYLQANLCANGWEDTEVYPVGVADKPGLATLFGASSTGASLIANWAAMPAMFKRRISVSTLDILIGDRFPDVRPLVKMDIEGLEFVALRGASKLIQRRLKPSWLVEITLGEYHPGAPNPHFADTFELFWRAGYLCKRLERDQLREVTRADVVRWLELGHAEGPWVNYLFSEPAMVARF